ncbi:MAG: hypothetical protein ACR2NF_10980 [Pirellulales bacterium]
MSRSRDTSNVYEIQDELARAYKSPTEPTREKERLADVWVVEGTLRENQPKPTVHQKPIRVRSKPKKHAKLYLLKKGNNNGN